VPSKHLYLFAGKSDPYVTFELEQDNYVLDKNFGRKESTHKRNDCLPTFEETFEWEDIPSLDNMVLWVKVWDDDIGRDDQIGDGKIKLEGLGISDEPKEVELVVDKKSAEVSICSPSKSLCACCCSMFKSAATMHLKISYRE